jgi:hypothetical protein
MLLKVQTVATRITASSSDEDDEDDPITARSLDGAQSTASHVGYKSFNEPGFLNVAMHSLVTNELKSNGGRNLPDGVRFSNAGGGGSSRLPARVMQGDELNRSHDSLKFSRYHANEVNAANNRISRMSVATTATTNAGTRKFSIRKKAHNYYNGSKEPPASWSDTKASILRKRSMITAAKGKKTSKEAKLSVTDYNRPNMRKSLRLSKSKSVSLGDLSSKRMSKDSAAASKEKDKKKESVSKARRASSPHVVSAAAMQEKDAEEHEADEDNMDEDVKDREEPELDQDKVQSDHDDDADDSRRDDFDQHDHGAEEDNDDDVDLDFDFDKNDTFSVVKEDERERDE